MVTRKLNSATRVFWTLCIMGFFAILSSTMSKSPVLKPFASSLGTPTDLVGIIAAASTIPGILISLPVASLSDFYGRRKFLLLSGFVFASAPFFYLAIKFWWQLILVRFYHGFATAIFVPVAEASVAELFPTKRGERISLFSSATYVGRVFAPTLGGYVLFITASSFQILYLSVAVAGITALVMAVLFLTGREISATPKQIRVKEAVNKIILGWKVIVGNKKVLIICIVQSALYYAYGSAEFYLAGYLPEIVHLNEFLTGIIITSTIAVAILARPYMGRISDKVERGLPIILGCLASALPLFFFPFQTNFWILILLAIVYGFGFATVTASTPALISELTPEELVGTSMGFLDTTMDIGQTLGPMVSGIILATNLQYHGVFISLALVLLGSCIVFALFDKSPRHVT